MKVWGSLEVPNKIEFISYSPRYRQETLDVIRQAFYPFETVSIASEISGNVEAENDLQGLCNDILQKTGVSIIARDVGKNKLVGVAINLVQVKTPSSDEPSYFESYRDLHCKTENAKSLMNYMIEADSRIDIFEKFGVNSVLEIMFLAVLNDYNGKGIGCELVKYSVELAEDIKSGKDREKYLGSGEPAPQLVAALWTGRGTQAIGKKLGFEVIFKETFAHFSFEGKNFAERVKDLSLEHHVAVKKSD